MRRYSLALMRGFAAMVLVMAQPGHPALATGTAPGPIEQIDPAPCLSATAAHDDDLTVAECGRLIDQPKTARADRIKALIARAGVFAGRNLPDRAIADYDVVLQLDPKSADIYNARGELWWKTGDRPKALADFSAALKQDPNHPAARGNYKSLARELERLGALMAVAGKPGFDCATVRRPVEKAICADPELASLDRQINAVNAKVVRDATRGSANAGRVLQREQEEYLARCDAGFGQPGYDLRKVMRERLDHLLSIER